MVKKKALFVATIYGFLNSFETNNMRLLQEMGYEVHCMANPFQDQDPAKGRVETPNIDAIGGIIKHDWVCARSPYDRNNILALHQLQVLLKQTHFDIVHCHTPMGGVLARIACAPYRKQGLKVIYTAHGFHFFRGAPRKNWLIYYPIEKELSRVTDTLVMINQNDFLLAKNHFHAGQYFHVPGVGVDTDAFAACPVTREEKRKELGLPQDAFVLLSVGELNENKNHEVIIRAIGRIPYENIYYLVAGEGQKRDNLLELARQSGLDGHVRLLGYRTDIAELHRAADVFCFPSIREGLGLAAIEAMASGLPVITSRSGGIKEYSIQGKTGYNCDATDIDGFAAAISRMQKENEEDGLVRYSESVRNMAKRYDISRTEEIMQEVYVNE